VTQLTDWKPVYSGKVRELYIPHTAFSISDAASLLMVATDRVSAFDHILTPDVPDKGVMLTALSRWWFGMLLDTPHHLTQERPPDEVAARAMVVEPLDMFPIECVVRGFIAGSGWKEYQSSGKVCGIALPAGLSEGDELAEPVFTPATKAAPGEHDENISFDQVEAILGKADASALRALSLELYARASSIAKARGLILADTKFEWGRHRLTGEITLGDEVLTSDSSRYWDGDIYSRGGIGRLDSFDKQLVRNWLSENWDFTGQPPTLPDDLVAHTQNRYQELLTRLTSI
jgi:phosphoribosylaminoimidazole-succinocarboxamide synthase